MSRVYPALRELIRDRRWPDDQPLDARDLAGRFGVSATVIRDALNILAGEGLARHMPNQGFFPPSASAEALSDAYAMMRVLLRHAIDAIPDAAFTEAAAAGGTTGHGGQRGDAGESPAERIECVFGRIAAAAPSPLAATWIAVTLDLTHAARRIDVETADDLAQVSDMATRLQRAVAAADRPGAADALAILVDRLQARLPEIAREIRLGNLAAVTDRLAPFSHD